jgi:hypothetical protein
MRVGPQAGETESKSSARIYSTFGLDPATVPFDHSLGQGKANAGAFELLHVMETLKDTEQLADISHFEPRAVVANRAYRFAATILADSIMLCR